MLDNKDFLIGLEDLKNMRVVKATLENEVKDVNERMSILLFELIEYMENSELESIKIAGIGLCSLTRSKKYSIENPIVFEEWMKEHGEMDNVLAVHASKVHGYYKEKLDNNEELPPGIKTFVKQNISIRS